MHLQHTCITTLILSSFRNSIYSIQQTRISSLNSSTKKRIGILKYSNIQCINRDEGEAWQKNKKTKNKAQIYISRHSIRIKSHLRNGAFIIICCYFWSSRINTLIALLWNEWLLKTEKIFAKFNIWKKKKSQFFAVYAMRLLFMSIVHLYWGNEQQKKKITSILN